MTPGSAALPLFDSHCHCDDPDWPPARLLPVVAQLPDWSGAITAGYGPERFAASRAVCAAEPRIRRAIGLHPWWLADHSEDERRAGMAALQAELTRNDAVALGELGLDKNRKHLLPAADQLRWMRLELELARALQLPVVLHIVGWHGHALDALRAIGGPWRGVVHRFSGPPEAALAYAALGLGVSLALEPRPNLAKRAAVAQALPEQALMIETDWPFLDHDYPAALGLLRALAADIALWRATTADAIIATSNRNTVRQFGLQN